MTDLDTDIESDLEAELEDLRRLTEALEDDESGPSRGASRFSINTSQSTYNSVPDDFINIDTAIALNRLYDEKLQSFEKMLIKRLNECRQRLREVQATDTIDISDKSNLNTFRYINCGKPYFKDMYRFPAPDNEDTLLRARSGMYDFSSTQSFSGWTIKDKNQFNKFILKLSKEIRSNELRSKIAQIRRTAVKDITKDKNIIKEIFQLQKQMEKLPKMTLKDLALPIDKEYDWDYVANKLNNRHKPQEYRGLWKLFLHPSINKNPWCKREHAALQKIVNDKQFQDWDAIAEELNTGRSPYQCFVFFRTNLGNSSTANRWTKDEEEYLKRLIEYYREDNYIPWSKIAASMEKRTKIQIYNKYLRMAEQRKGRFLPEEDAVILTFAERYGPDFKRMVWYLPGRSITQCRVRYQILSKKKVSTQWTIEEDRKLVQLMANQDHFKNYSSITKHFPGKDRVHIRSRYLILEKWMMTHPNLDVEQAPRRGPRRLKRGYLTDNLNKAIDNLKSRIKCDIEENKTKVVTMHSSEQKIDDAIVDFFIKQQIKFEETNKLRVHESEMTDEISQNENEFIQNRQGTVNVTNLRQVLILLKAKLNKEKFLKSNMLEKYPDLLKCDPLIYKTVKKSYSRKEPVESSSQAEKCPDVWGNNSLGRLDFVLPPNYATITGLRKILHYISQDSNDVPKKTLARNIHINRIFRDQITLLVERFRTLFMWPTLLSNMPPNMESSSTYQPPVKKNNNVPYQKEDYSLALPKWNEEKIINDVIDLNDNDKEDVTLKEGFGSYGFE